MPFIEQYLKEIKRLDKSGRCLHFESGARCNAIINAHTIQLSNLLSLVQENGHVVSMSANYSDLKNNEGVVVARKIGVNKISTFLGFCQKHDNELFELIDNNLFSPNKRQVFLYSYRALCREYFLKENAVELFLKQSERTDLSEFQRKILIKANLHGSQIGFKLIAYHKKHFDESLRSLRWEDIRYVSFNVQGNPTVLVSGAVFPDFDFLGNTLQDLDDPVSALSLVAFFTAPTDTGWSFVFAWHKSSDAVCQRLKGSLAACVHNKKSLSDILFRCIFSWSENHAMSPTWWDSLTEEQKQAVCQRVQYISHPTSLVRSDYLQVGLEGICKWNVESVQ